MADSRRTQQVSLGCGTLILIALIVLMFSGRGVGDLNREVHGLRSEIGRLKEAVELQTNQIKLLQEKLDKLQPGSAKGEAANAKE